MPNTAITRPPLEGFVLDECRHYYSRRQGRVPSPAFGPFGYNSTHHDMSNMRD